MSFQKTGDATIIGKPIEIKKDISKDKTKKINTGDKEKKDKKN